LRAPYYRIFAELEIHHHHAFSSFMLRNPVTFSRSSNIQQRTTKHLKLFQTTDNRYGLFLCCDVLKPGYSILWFPIWALHRSGMGPETENQVKKKILPWLFPRWFWKYWTNSVFFLFRSDTIISCGFLKSWSLIASHGILRNYQGKQFKLVSGFCIKKVILK